MLERLPVVFRSAMYALRGGFLIRPLAIAVVFGAMGAVLSSLEESTPEISAWIPHTFSRPRRGTLSATELLPPSEQLADVNAGGSRHFRGHCARLQRRSNDPLFLGNRPSTPALHRRDHLDLRLAHPLKISP